MLFGAGILAGWGLELPWLISLRPQWPGVPPITAAACLLCGMSVCGAVLSADRVAPLRWVSRAGAIALVLGGLLKLSEIAAPGQVLPSMLGFQPAVGSASLPFAQMAMVSAVEFTLLGLALLLSTETRFGRTFETLILSAAALSWLDLYNYLCADTPLPPFTHVNPLTATGCLLLSGGIFCMRMDAGRAQILFSNSAGGTLARRLLPPTLLLPFALGWLRLKTQQIGWLSADGAALTFELANALLIGTCVWVTARFLHRSSVKRRQVEEAMRENMERLATIVATEPECVKVIDSAGRLVEMNPAGLEMLEVDSLEEAQQLPLIESILPPYRARFAELHRTVMSGGTASLEFEIQGRRGTRRWLETHAAPLRDKGGGIWAHLGIARDISTRKRAESSQAQAQLFRGLLDRANDLIYVADAVSGRVLDCNAALPQRLGYTYDEVGQLFVWELSTAAGAPADWAERVARVQVSGSLVIESDYRCKDGTMLPVEINLRYVEDPQPLLIAVTRDVTERRLQQARAAHFTRILKMQSAIHGAVLRIRNPDEFLQEACRVAVELGGYPRAIISMVDPEGRRVCPKYRFGLMNLEAPESFPVGDGTEADRSITGRAVRVGEVVVCEDLRRFQPPMEGRDELLRLGIRSIIALPLTVEGTRLGALTLLSQSEERMPDEELMLLQDVAATLGLGLRSQQQADAAQYLTHYDPLTGLAKRALFLEHLNSFIHEGAARLTHPVIAVFDVQDLSSVNDTFGRSFGDTLLQRVAERARLAVEHERLVGHLGGGTFALAIRTFRGVADSAAAAIDHTVFEQPFEIEGRSLRVTCRSGMARFAADGQEAATLLQKAEAALGQAKESGERHLNFKLQMRSDVARRLQLEHELRDALDGGQFVLYYQPQVSISTGRITSVEALLRWRKPQAGLVLPAQFLPVLESSEMIVPVGDWVLKQAAHDCRQCLNRGLIPLRISVNVSALQIRRRGFVEEILAVAEPFGTADVGVDIEITESSVLQDLEDTRRKLQRLREAGVRIAIDDFGTGYSSLSLLPTLPVDILKIDRSFIQGLPGDPASVALTSSIIQIASSFGLATVAEGVESAAQLDLLRTLKCHQSQGYLHFKPMPFAELQALLVRQAAGLAGTDAASWRADSLAV
jgi:diguanylate cyclase (GGDEF)-like protein/PAS domain S-box-containing protein